MKASGHNTADNIILFGEQIHLSFANFFPETSVARKCFFFFFNFFFSFLNESHAFIQLDNNEALLSGG